MARKSTTATTAPDTRIRFIAKPYGQHWRVYDRLVGSYPVSRPEFDSALPMYADEQTCAEKAQELDQQYRNTNPTTKQV